MDTSAAIEEVCVDGVVCDVWGDIAFQAPKLFVSKSSRSFESIAMLL